jgi:CBS domain containing-hemolysin-like protein
VGHPGLEIVLICLFLFATLLISVTIIALRSFSYARLQEAFKKLYGSPQGEAHLDAFMAQEERLTVACSWYLLLARTCTLLLLTYVFTQVPSFSVRTAYGVTLAVALAVFTVFSVAIPNAWAKYAGEKFLAVFFNPLRLLVTMAAPLLFMQRWYDSLIRRLAGVAEVAPDQQQEEKHEEFLTELEQHRMEGAVDQEEQEMIENVLEFSDSTADEIMTPRTDLVAVDVNSDLPTVLEIITQAGHSRVPVYEETVDHIVGLIYAKDLLKEIGKAPETFTLRERLREVYFVPEAKPLRALLHEFQSQKQHIAVVLDEYGGTAGIVTMEDILEELVGEITDEYENASPVSIQEVDANTLELDARTYVDDLNDQYDLKLPEDEDYDTVGGFVFTQLGFIPKAGETFQYEGLTFTVLSAEARRINRIRIERIAQNMPREGDH